MEACSCYIIASIPRYYSIKYHSIEWSEFIMKIDRRHRSKCGFDGIINLIISPSLRNIVGWRLKSGLYSTINNGSFWTYRDIILESDVLLFYYIDEFRKYVTNNTGKRFFRWSDTPATCNTITMRSGWKHSDLNLTFSIHWLTVQKMYFYVIVVRDFMTLWTHFWTDIIDLFMTFAKNLLYLVFSSHNWRSVFIIMRMRQAAHSYFSSITREITDLV